MKILRQDDGSALVEFAAFLSVMVLMLVASVDYAVLIVDRMQLQQAATDAAQFGAIPGNESNLSTIQSYALSLVPYISGATAQVTNVWVCTPGGASVSSTSTCTGGVTPYKYVAVTTSASIPRPLAYTGVAAHTTLQGFAEIRVPWTP